VSLFAVCSNKPSPLHVGLYKKRNDPTKVGRPKSVKPAEALPLGKAIPATGRCVRRPNSSIRRFYCDRKLPFSPNMKSIFFRRR
jgi:hypothetical protein